MNHFTPTLELRLAPKHNTEKRKFKKLTQTQHPSSISTIEKKSNLERSHNKNYQKSKLGNQVLPKQERRELNPRSLASIMQSHRKTTGAQRSTPKSKQNSYPETESKSQEKK